MNRQENFRLRASNLQHIPLHLQRFVLELEKDYGRYCFVPLDIPVIFDEKIVDWFFEYKKSITKLKPDVADTKFGYSLFNSVNVCLDDRYKVANPIWSDNQYPSFKQDFPHFYQQMMDYLPLAKIPRFSFWNSTSLIAPHRDHSCLLDMPTGVRVMVYDENPVDTLYFYEDTESYKGRKTYISRITETNSFVWNNLRVEHGSDYDVGYSKILLIINDFIPDYKKYRDLIDRSILKYADKLVISDNAIEDFI